MTDGGVEGEFGETSSVVTQAVGGHHTTFCNSSRIERCTDYVQRTCEDAVILRARDRVAVLHKILAR